MSLNDTPEPTLRELAEMQADMREQMTSMYATSRLALQRVAEQNDKFQEIQQWMIVSISNIFKKTVIEVKNNFNNYRKYLVNSKELINTNLTLLQRCFNVVENKQGGVPQAIDFSKSKPRWTPTEEASNELLWGAPPLQSNYPHAFSNEEFAWW